MNGLVSNFIGFDGRLNRQPFWISGIILAVISILVSLILLPLIGLSIMPALPNISGATSAQEIADFVNAARAKAGWASLVLYIVFLYPTAAICVKRRHDRNNNGIDVWIYLAIGVISALVNALGIGMTTMEVQGVVMPVPGVPVMGLGAIMAIFGLYLLVVLGFLKGTAGPNSYGPDPLQG